MAALALIGSLVGAAGTVAGGIAAKKDANFEAAQMEMKANEERAAAQREAGQARTESELAMSRAQALAASSGGGADAPTIVKLMSGLAGQGELNAQSALAGGESRASGLKDSAIARRRQGKSSFLGSVIGGFGQAASGISGAYKGAQAAKGWG